MATSSRSNDPGDGGSSGAACVVSGTSSSSSPSSSAAAHGAKATTAAAMAALEPVECFLCAEPCRAVCVFACGHFTCYACGLRIHNYTRAGCPVCRVRGEAPVVTRAVSAAPDAYSEDEVRSMRSRASADAELHCLVDGADVAYEMSKLYSNLCPRPQCWFHGEQDAFVRRGLLLDHLRVNHHQRYCVICLQHRPAFLCEQVLYTKETLQYHRTGRCAHDTPSFTGHPQCRFCDGLAHSYFYDSDALFEHMRADHYTCDLCNRDQFLFTFYRNRDTLLAHFRKCHKLCDHRDCVHLDPMARVFTDDIALAAHKQREHGIRQHNLFTPGVVSTTMTAMSSSRHNNSNNSDSGSGGGNRAMHAQGSGSGSTPATASNVNVTAITFDFVDHVERVDMLPSRHAANRFGGGRDHVHAAGSAGAQHGEAAAAGDASAAAAATELSSSAQTSSLSCHGLPSHYYRAGSFDVMLRPLHASAPGDGRRGASLRTPSHAKDDDGSGGSGARGDKDDEGDAHAFGVLSYSGNSRSSGSARGAAAVAAAARGEAQQRHEAQRQLDALLQRTLTSAHDKAAFVQCTDDYVHSRCNTTEYYDHLVRLFAVHDDGADGGANNGSGSSSNNNNAAKEGSQHKGGNKKTSKTEQQQQQQQQHDEQQERRSRAVLREVLQLVVAALQSPEKRVALQDLWKIKMAPETRHMERVRAARAHEQAAQQTKTTTATATMAGGGSGSGRSSAAASPTSRSGSGGGGGGGRHGGNTWQQRQQQHQLQQQRSNNAWFARGSSVVVAANVQPGGASAHDGDDDNDAAAAFAQPPIATTTTTAMSPSAAVAPELYPALPQRGVRRSGAAQQHSHKGQASRTTVWRTR